MKRNKNVHFGFIFSSSSPSIFSFSFSVQIPISSLLSKLMHILWFSIFINFIFSKIRFFYFSAVYSLFWVFISSVQFSRILNILILVTFQLPKVYFNKILFLARFCRIQPFSLFFAPTLNRLDLEPGHYLKSLKVSNLVTLKNVHNLSKQPKEVRLRHKSDSFSSKTMIDDADRYGTGEKIRFLV